jgi:hypothetical protein
MSTMSSRGPAPLADDGSHHLLLEVVRTIRDNLHTLCAMSLGFLIVALPWVVLGTITSWVFAWAPLVMVTAPVWMTIVVTSERLLIGDAVSWKRAARDLRQTAGSALTIGMLPAICGTVLLVAGAGASDAAWRGAGVLVGAGLALALLVLLIPAVPLAARYGLAGLILWQASAVVVVRRPAPVIGTVVLAAAGLWLAVMFGPALLLGVAPLGVLVAAITLPDPE